MKKNSPSRTPALVRAVVHVAPISFSASMRKYKSFLACMRLSSSGDRSSAGKGHPSFGKAANAKTVPALKAALCENATSVSLVDMQGREGDRTRAHSWTPGAVRVSPDEPFESLTSRTMLLAAMRHFSVLTSSVVSCLPPPVVVDADDCRKNLSRTLASGTLRTRP